MAKRNSDPRIAYPEIKFQVRDILRVAGIVATFAPVGAFTRGKFVLSSFREKMGTGDGTGPSASCVCCCPLCPTGGRTPAAVRHGRARQTSGTEPCEDYRKVMWLPGPRGQYSGKIRLSRNLGYKTRGRHMVKCSSDPRVAYPEIKLQVRDPVRVVGIVAPFRLTGSRYPGKIRFIEPQ